MESVGPKKDYEGVLSKLLVFILIKIVVTDCLLLPDATLFYHGCLLP